MSTPGGHPASGAIALPGGIGLFHTRIASERSGGASGGLSQALRPCFRGRLGGFLAARLSSARTELLKNSLRIDVMGGF